MPKLYQHIPVRAEQYDGSNNPFERLALSQPVPFLQTPHGIVPVLIGDWVVRVWSDHYEAVKPDVFERLYDEYVPLLPPLMLEPTPPPTGDWPEAEEVSDVWDDTTDP